MPNRFIARITVIAFHKSPPRGVGMLVGQFFRDFAMVDLTFQALEVFWPQPWSLRRLRLAGFAIAVFV